MRDEDAAVEMVPRTNRRRSDDTRRTQEQIRRNEQELQQLRNRVRDQRIQIAQNTADNKQQVNYITQLEVENQNSRARYQQQTTLARVVLLPHCLPSPPGKRLAVRCTDPYKLRTQQHLKVVTEKATDSR